MKALNIAVAVCVVGIVLSFAGALFTGYKTHQEKSQPQPTVFPTPAIAHP